MATLLKIFPRNRHSIVRICVVVLVMIGCSLFIRSSINQNSPYDVIHDVIPDFHDTLNEVQDTEVKIPSNITIVNPHPFKVLLSPRNLCTSQDKLLAMIYIHSRPNSFRLRDNIRQTWGNMSRFSCDIRIAFVLGTMPQRPGLQIALSAESRLYNDIIQEDFVDSYKNLTYKAICALRWVTNHCTHAQFILKVDDDVLVDTFTLVRVLRSLSTGRPAQTGKLWCRLWLVMKVERTGKWRVDSNEFLNDFYPPYCSGMAYMMTSDVAKSLYIASYSVPFFWVDDVYVTGMLPAKVSLSQTDLEYYFVLRPENLIREKYMTNDGHNSPIFAHIGGTLYSGREMWNNIVELEKHISKRGTVGLNNHNRPTVASKPSSTTIFNPQPRQPIFNPQPRQPNMPWR